MARKSSTPKRSPPQYRSLFDSVLVPHGDSSTLTTAKLLCSVVAVGKRRDGGTRYWCLSHKADATAKYGKPARECRAADVPPLRKEDVLTLHLDEYPGGVALWGAVPAVYDTTRLPVDRGIHVHARSATGAKKALDCTRRAVRILGKGMPQGGVLLNELDAIYYLVSSVFGHQMTYVECSHCGWPHLDKDWFSVHPHQRHLCAGCGLNFRDSVIGIGNPIIGIRRARGSSGHRTTPSKKKLDIRQADYPGGIQIWGSNSALLWTSGLPEEKGIHIHAFLKEGDKEPAEDDTYGEVIIDGVRLDPVMVRMLMVQNVMPSLKGRVRSMNCPRCHRPHLELGEAAYTPATSHACGSCGHQFSTTGRLRNAVINPLPAILAELARLAPRPPQRQQLDLLPETLKSA